MLEKETKILKDKYEETLRLVKGDDFGEAMTKWKLKHSMQVKDVGELLIKSENFEQNWPADKLLNARIAVLLHDIGRFEESGLLSGGVEHKFIDHSLLGADFLRKIPEYNLPEIIIPIKHHGHMIEELYEDEEYRNLDAQTQQNVRDIIFLVRDADKLANLRAIIEEDDQSRKLFVEKGTKDKHISKEVLADFRNKKPIKRCKIKTLADRMVNIIAFIFDINYKSSFVFLNTRPHIMQGLLGFLNDSTDDKPLQKEIEKMACDFINERVMVV